MTNNENETEMLKAYNNANSCEFIEQSSINIIIGIDESENIGIMFGDKDGNFTINKTLQDELMYIGILQRALVMLSEVDEYE